MRIRTERKLTYTHRAQGPRDMTNPCPLWNQCFQDFAELACYGSSQYKFHDVTNHTIAAELLGGVGLGGAGDWDLVSLDGTQRVWAFPDFFGNLDHYRHVLYLNDDVNKRYYESGCGFPGQTVPCRCKEQPRGNDLFDHWHRRFEVQGHLGSFLHNPHCQAFHGGEIVFARRKLEDSALVQNLDRFWLDWVSGFFLFCCCLMTDTIQNDCMFIQGRGLDAHGKLIDGNTMYILETLPGIKARLLKSGISEEARKLTSACHYFNLKLENREFDAIGRSMLQEIMGAEYHPRYSDYTYLVDPRVFDFSLPEACSWAQPGVMTAVVPMNKRGRSGQHGNTTRVRDSVAVWVMAEAENEPVSKRLETFRRNVSNQTFLAHP